MPSDLAISLKNVTKEYRLHGSQADQLIDVLGLQRFGIKPRAPVSTFTALRDISFDVPHGHRIGIIGRNGAGKTTLLKLICGNFSPTSGEIEINGTVQALMGVGLGFHPDYTGRQNIEASLHYNGLTKGEYEAALDGIIDFCELGEFLDQPFKTYSLGMQARLMFATATSIRPDILIVDEVLGAGDAYFVAKSKRRVEALVQSGCTMLLVSHSMSQVLELCDEAIWLDRGQIRMRGESFEVVKKYEESMHAPLDDTSGNSQRATQDQEIQAICQKADALSIQEPHFVPFCGRDVIKNVSPRREFHFVAKGGISRWAGAPGLKICGFSITTEAGTGNKLVALKPAKLIISIYAETEGQYDCRYGIAIHDYSGACITNIYSPRDSFFLRKDELRAITAHLNPCQLGTGSYVIGMSVLKWEKIELINSATRYDLLSRSFTMKAEVVDSMAATDAMFYHNAEWMFT